MENIQINKHFNFYTREFDSIVFLFFGSPAKFRGNIMTGMRCRTARSWSKAGELSDFLTSAYPSSCQSLAACYVSY